MSPSPAGKRGARKALLICAAVVLILCLAVAVYSLDYSRADAEAVSAMRHATVDDKGMYAFGDAGAGTGLVFYPGGKVMYTAYAPLAQRIAETAGLFVVVPKMPLNLAVLDMDAAEAVMARYPAVTKWYVGGHSLGGSMAAAFAAAHPDEVAGVLLLAAYATDPLTVPALCVYGERDTVLNREKYDSARAYLPPGYGEVVIAGGNHARFGCYGAQKGDSPAAITAREQQRITAEAVRDWIHAPAA